MFGPEFARGLLLSIDNAVASLDAVLVGGGVKDHEHYVALVGERRGLRKARAAVVERLDSETRLLLGMPVKEGRPVKAA